MMCVHGATGHPNVEGAKAYAAAISAALDGFGVGWMGLKVMSVCADAVVTAEPKPTAYRRNDVAEPPANLNISDETFSITFSAKDAITNAPLAAVTADVAGKGNALGGKIPLTLCKTGLPSRVLPHTLGFVNTCTPTPVTVRSTGYAKVSFAVADIFDGEIPGSTEASPAPVGTAFHFCAPLRKLGTPPKPPATTLGATVTGQGREGKTMPMRWWVIVATTDSAGTPRPAGADAVTINGAHGFTGKKIVFNVCGGSEPAPCTGTVTSVGFFSATFQAGPEK